VNTGHFGDIKAHSLSFEIEAIRKLREMGEDEPTPVYGIRTADLKKFREHGEWYELGEWIREQIWETWEEDADLRRAHRFYKHDLDRYGSEIERPYATMYDFPTRAFDALVSLAKKLPKDSFITQYMEQLNRLPLKKAKLSHLASLKQWHVNYFTLTWDRPVDLKHDIFLPIVQRYPMLAFSLEHVEKKPHQEQIVKYVTFMDKMHKLKAEGYAIVKKKAE
jgi:hypothetical protein